MAQGRGWPKAGYFPSRCTGFDKDFKNFAKNIYFLLIGPRGDLDLVIVDKNIVNLMAEIVSSGEHYNVEKRELYSLMSSEQRLNREVHQSPSSLRDVLCLRVPPRPLDKYKIRDFKGILVSIHGFFALDARLPHAPAVTTGRWWGVCPVVREWW